jgi:hypothetical protein
VSVGERIQRRKSAFVMKGLCETWGEQIHSEQADGAFSISRKPGAGDHFRPDWVDVFRYTRRCVRPAVKHGQNAMVAG